MFLEWIEIMVAVEERMPRRQTESCDQTVYGLPDCMAACSEGTIILRGGDSQFSSSSVEHFEPGHVPPHPFESRVFTDSLQDFAQNKVGQTKPLLIQLSV
jgi:hypothetical protein